MYPNGMQAHVAQLRDRIEAIEQRFARDRAASTPLGWGVPLEHGAIHEWMGRAPAVREGSGPAEVVAEAGVLSVLVGVVRRLVEGADPGRRVVWIGRRVWPYPPMLGGELLERSVFVDPADHGERVWAMDLCLRSRAAVAVVGDGRGLTMAESRRLQLAAGDGGGVGLFVRSMGESGVISAARTRWVVEPEPATDGRPRWAADLARARGTATGGARRWVVRMDDEAGLVGVDQQPVGRCAAPARAGA